LRLCGTSSPGLEFGLAVLLAPDRRIHPQPLSADSSSHWFVIIMISMRPLITVALSAFLFSLSQTGIDAFSSVRRLLSTHLTVNPSKFVGRGSLSRTQTHLVGGTGETDNGLPAAITKVANIQDFLDFIAEDDRLSIVKFHAAWCKSCQKFGLRYKKLALEEGDKVDCEGRSLERGRVRFAEVEFNSNIKLCRSLGIKRLPHIHMYKGSQGRIEDFSCSPKNFHTVIDKLNENVDITVEDIAFRRDMDAGSVLLDEVVADLQLSLQGKNGTHHAQPKK